MPAKSAVPLISGLSLWWSSLQRWHCVGNALAMADALPDVANALPLTNLGAKTGTNSHVDSTAPKRLLCAS